jgi:hypothetical protein
MRWLLSLQRLLSFSAAASAPRGSRHIENCWTAALCPRAKKCARGAFHKIAARDPAVFPVHKVLRMATNEEYRKELTCRL